MCLEVEKWWPQKDEEIWMRGWEKMGRLRRYSLGAKTTARGQLSPLKKWRRKSEVVYPKMVHTVGWVCKSMVTTHYRTCRSLPFKHKQLVAIKVVGHLLQHSLLHLPQCSMRQSCLLTSALAWYGNNFVLNKWTTNHSSYKMRYHSEIGLSVCAE